MQLSLVKRTGMGLALLSGLMLSALVLAACGDKVEIKNPQISLQPGANWQFQGQVETIDNPWWVVGQQRILVNQATLVDNDPSPKVGSEVKIEGHTKEGGVLEASSIKVVIIIGVPSVTPAGTLTVAPTQTVAASPSVGPTATPNSTLTVAPTSTSGPTATVGPTATPVPATATAIPVGTTIQIIGVIQQIIINNNQTIIIVDNRQYVLSPALVAVIKPRLVIGVSINFVGRYDPGNVIVIINVTKINNQVIVINNGPVIVTGEDEQGGKDHKSNGNCEGHSNGNCQGSKDKGKDDKGGKPKK